MTLDKCAKITIFPFGASIVELDSEIESLSVLWRFTNSWDADDGYFYSKPRQIIEKDGKFYHIFFKDGYCHLNSNDIGRTSGFRGDASVILFPKEKGIRIKGIYDIVN